MPWASSPTIGRLSTRVSSKRVSPAGSRAGPPSAGWTRLSPRSKDRRGSRGAHVRRRPATPVRKDCSDLASARPETLARETPARAAPAVASGIRRRVQTCSSLATSRACSSWPLPTPRSDGPVHWARRRTSRRPALRRAGSTPRFGARPRNRPRRRAAAARGAPVRAPRHPDAKFLIGERHRSVKPCRRPRV